MASALGRRPGLAKTLAVRTLSKAIDTHFQRVQFTPDLLPADLLGTQIYNPKDSQFTVKKGPIFTESPLGRRNQPRAVQSSERALGSHAGASGDDRRTKLSAG